MIVTQSQWSAELDVLYVIYYVTHKYRNVEGASRNKVIYW